MISTLLRLFFQPVTNEKKRVKKKEVYHFVLNYQNESGYYCTYRTYALTYQAAKNQLLAEYEGKTLLNISLKSKNLQ